MLELFAGIGKGLVEGKEKAERKAYLDIQKELGRLQIKSKEAALEKAERKRELLETLQKQGKGTEEILDPREESPSVSPSTGLHVDTLGIMADQPADPRTEGLGGIIADLESGALATTPFQNQAQFGGSLNVQEGDIPVPFEAAGLPAGGQEAVAGKSLPEIIAGLDMSQMDLLGITAPQFVTMQEAIKKGKFNDAIMKKLAEQMGISFEDAVKVAAGNGTAPPVGESPTINGEQPFLQNLPDEIPENIPDGTLQNVPELGGVPAVGDKLDKFNQKVTSATYGNVADYTVGEFYANPNVQTNKVQVTGFNLKDGTPTVKFNKNEVKERTRTLNDLSEITSYYDKFNPSIKYGEIMTKPSAKSIFGATPLGTDASDYLDLKTGLNPSGNITHGEINDPETTSIIKLDRAEQKEVVQSIKGLNRVIGLADRTKTGYDILAKKGIFARNAMEGATVDAEGNLKMDFQGKKPTGLDNIIERGKAAWEVFANRYTNEHPQIESLRKQNQLVVGIARGLGEKGTLSDSDVARAEGLATFFSETLIVHPEVAKQKYRTLIELIKEDIAVSGSGGLGLDKDRQDMIKRLLPTAEWEQITQTDTGGGGGSIVPADGSPSPQGIVKKRLKGQVDKKDQVDKTGG